MKKIETSSYKGVRDFYPDDMFILDYIQSVWHSVLQSYGYEHYSGSILEPSEIYEGKTSEEIVSEQTYSFVDRGGRRVTLRPEMTPTVARMVAARQKTISFPLRWYSIPNVFRYERPQKGRLREHWQLNVDIFGLAKIDAEAELIEIAYKIMQKFGMTEADFVIRINDRNLLDEVVKKIGLSDERAKEFRKLLDRKDKTKNFNEEMEKLIGRPFNETILPSDKIKKLTEKLNNRGIRNVVFDPLVVRGFDYYTGVVFEIFDTNPENGRSLFGGGRYDSLLEMFGAEKTPSVGFGMGDVTIKEALADRNLLPKNITPAHVFISTTDESVYDYAANFAQELRAEGLDVQVNYDDKKISEQLRRADKKGIPFTIVVGPEETRSGEFKIRALKIGKEKTLSRNKIASFVKDGLAG